MFCNKSGQGPCGGPLLKVGDRAPSFKGRDQNGREVTLEDLTAKGRVILYFYPKDFTRVCTSEACLFRDAAGRWKNTTIVGVSVDSDASHLDFAQCHDLCFPLISDSNREIARAYDALRFFGAFTKRVTYVIDEQGIVRGIFHHELSAEKHVADVDGLLAAMG